MSSATVPGPDGGPLGVKNILAFQQDALGFLVRMREEHGDVVRIRFGTADVYLLGHPDHARRILVEERDRLVKWAKIRPPFERIAATNLVILEGDAWERIRGLAMAAFHADRLEAYVARITAQARARIADW